MANDKIQAKYRNTQNGRTKILTEGFRVFSLARNAVAVIAGTLLAYIFSLHDSEPFVLIGKKWKGIKIFKKKQKIAAKIRSFIHFKIKIMVAMAT